MFCWCVKIDHDRVLLVLSSGLTGTTADAEQIADHLAVGAIFFARCFLFPEYVPDVYALIICRDCRQVDYECVS
jgi:hypothetical protein